MKVIYKEIGQKKKLDIIEEQVSELGPYEVLVKNTIIGFNPVDYKIYEGGNLLSNKIKDKLPWTPGFDITGVIEKIGKDVKDFKVGDRVCGMIGFPLKGGAYSNYTTCDESELVEIPNDVSDENAIYCCLSGVTAFQAYELSEMNTQLVLGGTGGVGAILLQLLSKRNKNSYYSFRSEKSKSFIASFPNSIPVSVKEIISNKLEFPEKFGIIDLVGGELSKQIINQCHAQLTTVVTVPTYSAKEIEDLCHEYNVEFKHFIVEKNTNQINKLLNILKNENRVFPDMAFELKKVEDLFDFYKNSSFVGKLSLKII